MVAASNTAAAFEYSYDPALAGAATTGPVAIGEGKEAVPVAATVSALYYNTTYYYRAIATGNGMTTRGPIRTFTTPLPPNDFARPPAAR